MRKVLVVDDTDPLREVICSVLSSHNYEPIGVADVNSALKILQTSKIDCILSDYKLVSSTGLDLLKKVRELPEQIPFILMTAFASVDIAVAAMKAGANDFIIKPFDPDLLSTIIEQICEHKRILDRTTSVKSKKAIVAKSPSMIELLNKTTKIAKVDSTVLILGESGTGKELLARYIHDNSSRRAKPFIAVNCAAIPSELLESEFFGHEAGSFTGATQKRLGVFEVSNEGTLFLDEIGDMPKHLQVKLLRALQEKEIRRVGGNKTINVNPRIISATNIDPFNGALREDLYYRLSVLTLSIPPLRERKEDLIALVEHFIKTFSQQMGIRTAKISEAALNCLISYPWPGNIRELENMVERAVILGDENIEVEHLNLPSQIKRRIDDQSSIISETIKSLDSITEIAIREAENKAIRDALFAVNQNKNEAAKLLKISAKTLVKKIKEYGLETP